MTLVDPIRSFRRRPQGVRRPDLASQWQLMWWKFRRHRLAMVGLVLLGLFLAFALFAEVDRPLSAAASATRTMWPARRCCRASSRRTARSTSGPSSMAARRVRDPVTLRMKHETDTTPDLAVRRSSSTASPTSLLGLIPMDIHLFGVDRGLRASLRHRFHRPRHLLAHHPRRPRLARRRLRRRRDLLHPRRGDRRRGRLFRRPARQYRDARRSSSSARSRRCRSGSRSPPLLPRDWAPLSTYLAITIILSLLGWTWLARTVRSKLLATRHEDFRARRAALRLLGRPHHPPPPAAVVHELPDRRHLDRLPGNPARRDLALLPRPRAARAGRELGRAALCGAEHPRHRPGALADDPRRSSSSSRCSPSTSSATACATPPTPIRDT